MRSAKDLFVDLLGTRAVSNTVKSLLAPELRILAYHGVPNPAAFRRQLDEVLSMYTPVSGLDVVRALREGVPLPARAIWITFDDGHSSVVENGLPLLQDRGLPSTLFVCPGLVDGRLNPWWESVNRAVATGWTPDGLAEGPYVTAIKDLSDQQRREYVTLAVEYLRESGESNDAPSSVATRSQLERWMSCGMELGNHTWDHPCLDRCDQTEQRRQIEEADAWLNRFGAFEDCRLFAYPNGDWTNASEAVLRNRHYSLGLLFDHRLSRITCENPLRISRLRLDTAASVSRARAIVSGGHSYFYRPAPASPDSVTGLARPRM